jgi:AraC family transcriptional activator FtrA
VVGVHWYRFEVAAAQPGPVRLDMGLDLMIRRGLTALRSADTIIVAGWSAPTPQITDALNRAHRRGARIVGFCSGTLLLAATGLLEGRRAATHWHLHEHVSERFPGIEIATDVLYVDDGDILTSAGSSAALDLALHIVRLDHGAAIANHVARNMVTSAHRHGGQQQFVVAPAAPCDPEDTISATMEWMICHLDDDLSLMAMARHAHLSTRQFARRFIASTGTTPHRWLTRHRIMRAQELLERGSLSIEEVAHATGFGSAAALRANFTPQVTTSPADYRRSFAGH